MAAKHSLTSLANSGVIRRRDSGYQIRHKDLVLGWNAREHTKRWEESIAALMIHLREGGQVPAIEVKVVESTGDVRIAEGYRRYHAYARLIEEGFPIDWINIAPFKGDETDECAHIANSNSQLELTPLEVASVYERLDKFNLSPDEIAKKVRKSRAHVDSYLLLAYSSVGVKHLVRSGLVAVQVAIDAIRKHGDQAGVVLEEQVQKGNGKKLTMGAINGKSLPKKVQAPYIASADTLATSLSIEVHTRLYEFVKLKKERGEEVADDETVSVEISVKALSEFLESHGNAEAAREKQLAKQRERAVKAAQHELEAASDE